MGTALAPKTFCASPPDSGRAREQQVLVERRFEGPRVGDAQHRAGLLDVVGDAGARLGAVVGDRGRRSGRTRKPTLNRKLPAVIASCT